MRLCRLLCLLAVVLPLLVEGVRPDTRCPGYIEEQPPLCTKMDPALYDGGNFVVDPTACWNGTNCPNAGGPGCLSGPEWTERLDALGVGKAVRTIKPVIFLHNWLAAELTATITMILAHEALGVNMDTAPVALDGAAEVICCDQFLINVEDWNTGIQVDDEGFYTLYRGGIGYTGVSGLFVPDYTQAAYPLATAYLAYKVLPDYQNIFPKGMSTPCENLLEDPSKGCVEGNFVCDKAPAEGMWTETKCTEGRYIPPQCEADPTQCQEIFLADPSWDIGYFESLVRNTGLPFVLAYMGFTGLPAEVARRKALGEHFVFYWYKPDPLVASVGGKPINFEPTNIECEQSKHSDPNISGIDCAYPNLQLQKVARRDELAKDPDFKFFFESLFLGSSEMDSMLAKHTGAGGTDNVYNLSCTWVRENYVTWKDWIKNTPPETQLDQGSSKSVTIGVGVGVPLAVVLFAGVALFFVVRMKKKPDVKYAPTKPPLVLVFTDVESSTMLWETYGDEMAKAMEIHHDVVRQTLDDFKSYEVKTIGDAFMIASESLIDATLMCVEIQTRLNEAEWPPALIDWKSSPDNKPADKVVGSAWTPGGGESPAEQKAMWKGLRVRMGMHYCREVEPKLDPVHLRYDYYGHDVNVSARVQSVAQGGQIFCSEETYRVLLDDPEYNNIADTLAIQCASSGVTLKGVADKVPMFQILPTALKYRMFDPIEGAIVEGSISGGAETASMRSDLESLVSLGMEGMDVPKRMAAMSLEAIMNSYGDKKKKSEFVNHLAKYLEIPESHSHRRKMLAIQTALSTGQGQTKYVPPPIVDEPGAGFDQQPQRSRRRSSAAARRRSSVGSGNLPGQPEETSGN